MKPQKTGRIHFARLLGLIGVVFFLLAFCTNNWLVGEITCSGDEEELVSSASGPQETEVGSERECNGTQDLGEEANKFLNQNHRQHRLTKRSNKSLRSKRNRKRGRPGGHSLLSMAEGKIICYEGFFWNCKIHARHIDDSYFTYMFSKEFISKSCVEAYHTPFPLNLNLSDHVYSSVIGYRHTWSTLMVFGVLIIGIGFALIVYESFRGQNTLYRMGGRCFFLAGILMIFSIIIYIVWIQSLTDLQYKIAESTNICFYSVKVYIRYGWTFLVTPVGIVTSLITGYLFHRI